MHLEAAQIVLCSVTFTLAAAAATEFKSLWHHSPPTFHHPPPRRSCSLHSSGDEIIRTKLSRTKNILIFLWEFHIINRVQTLLKNPEGKSFAWCRQGFVPKSIMCTYTGMSPTMDCSICSRSSKRRAQYKWSESTLFFFQHGAFIRVERPGPFKGHSGEKTYCLVKIGCPLSGPRAAYWVTSCWLASKSSVGYLKGGQSLDPCQVGCSHTEKWLAVHYQQYSPRSLDTSHILKCTVWGCNTR